MTISLVVSTIGRPGQLRRLLTSLQIVDRPDLLELIVVDQSGDRASARSAEQFGLPFPVITTVSPRGLSVGRNAGLALASGAIVTFPDDDCFYRPDTPSVAWRLLQDPRSDGVSGVQRTTDGRNSMLRWPTKPCRISRRNFHRTAISSTMFLRRGVVNELGGFDETLGAGSQHGYLSGEESDLVLRALEAGYRLHYDPSLVVLQDEPRDDLPPDYEQKMAGYGRGFGRLFAQHRLGRHRLEVLLVRKTAGSGLRRLRHRADLARADTAFVTAARQGYRSWR